MIQDSYKADYGKDAWHLLPLQPIRMIVQVLTFGALKYAPDQWKEVPDAKNRYFSAMLRHITAWWEGERTDRESGLHHLAHAGCCLIFLIWLDTSKADNGN